MTPKTIFDIETGPAPDTELALVKPQFKAPANYKDPAKIADAIAIAEADWKEKAALSPVTGRVLCIGMADGILEGGEPGIISAFWNSWRHGGLFIGWNCKGFDLPFLIRRSWALGVKIPSDLFEGRYFNSRVVDLMEKWACGNYGERESLDTAARTLGVGQKNGSGADFARLWREDKPKAIEYLQNDLRITAAIAERMGV